MSLNNMVILIGYVGQDIQSLKTVKGIKRVSLRIATHELALNKTTVSKWSTTWHNVVAWGKMAEYAECSLVKGSRIRINGQICYRKYEDPKGHTRYVTEIKAEYIQNLDR